MGTYVKMHEATECLCGAKYQRARILRPDGTSYVRDYCPKWANINPLWRWLPWIRNGHDMGSWWNEPSI